MPVLSRELTRKLGLYGGDNDYVTGCVNYTHPYVQNYLLHCTKVVRSFRIG